MRHVITFSSDFTYGLKKSVYGLLNESETARSIKDTQLDLRVMTYVAKEQKIFMLKLLVNAL